MFDGNLFITSVYSQIGYQNKSFKFKKHFVLS